MDHVRCAGQVEAGAARLERQDQKRRSVVRLEAVDHGAPLAHSRAAVQHQPRAAEQGRGVLGQGVDDLPVLSEYQHPLLAGRQLFAQLRQPQELAAGGGGVLAVTGELGWDGCTPA